MSEEQVLEQLYSLIDDRKSFITENSNDSEEFKRDITALETIINSYKNCKICLSGYRESLLRRTQTNIDVVEDLIKGNQKLKEQLKQRDEIIDEAIEIIDKMMYTGYATENIYYVKTDKESNFGYRASIVKKDFRKI